MRNAALLPREAKNPSATKMPMATALIASTAPISPSARILVTANPIASTKGAPASVKTVLIAEKPAIIKKTEPALDEPEFAPASAGPAAALWRAGQIGRASCRERG